MPRATRNTNANNGNPGSEPAKSKTYSNSSAEMPSAALNDSTTVPSRLSGAATARSHVTLDGGLDERHVVLDDGLAGLADALDPRHGLTHGVGAVGAGDHHHRVGGVDQPVLGERLLTGDRLDLLGVAVLGRQPGG